MRCKHTSKYIRYALEVGRTRVILIPGQVCLFVVKIVPFLFYHMAIVFSNLCGTHTTIEAQHHERDSK